MSGCTRRFRPSQNEIDRRYGNVRAAMEAAGLDAAQQRQQRPTGQVVQHEHQVGFRLESSVEADNVRVLDRTEGVALGDARVVQPCVHHALLIQRL